MDVRLLKYFVTVANEGSLTKAAKILHITQPTLSHQLKILEDELKCELFTRTSHGVKLTLTGTLLKNRAEDILEMLEKTENEFKNIAENMPADIYIGCSESEKLIEFMGLLKEFKEDNPYVKYHIYGNSNEEITRQLNNGLTDFAFIIGDFDYASFSSVKLPYENQVGILILKDDPLAQMETVNLELLLSLPIIKREPGTVHSVKNLEWMDNNHLNSVATYTSMSTAVHMLRAGIGYVLCFKDNVDLDLLSDVCFRPLYPYLHNDTHIIWKEHKEFNHLTKQLLDKIIKHYGCNNS